MAQLTVRREVHLKELAQQPVGYVEQIRYLVSVVPAALHQQFFSVFQDDDFLQVRRKPDFDATRTQPFPETRGSDQD